MTHYTSELSAFYTNPVMEQPAFRFWADVVLIVGMLLVLAWMTWRWSRKAFLALCLTVLPIVPALSGLRIYDQGNMIHDRYLYLSSAGLCILLAMSLTRCRFESFGIRGLGIATLVAISLGCSYWTIVQQQYYRNDEVSFSRGLQIDPKNSFVMDLLGKMYLKRGDIPAALEWFRRAQQVDPENPEVVLQLGRGLFQAAQYEDASAVLSELSERPGIRENERSLAFLYGANALTEFGDLSGAEQKLRKLEQLNSKYPALHRTLGIVFQREGRLPEAQSEYEKEFVINGDMDAGKQASALKAALASVVRRK